MGAEPRRPSAPRTTAARPGALRMTWPRWLLPSIAVSSLVALTALGVVVSNGALVPAVAPALAALVVVACIRLPLTYTLTGAVFVALVFHNPGGAPHANAWQGPLYAIGLVLF